MVAVRYVYGMRDATHHTAPTLPPPAADEADLAEYERCVHEEGDWRATLEHLARMLHHNEAPNDLGWS